MIEIVRNAASLLIAGKLFADRAKATKQLLTGIGLGVLAMLIASLAAPVWFAAIVGGAVTGYLQPILFKDLKYA
jgi:hypothetical protein